MLEGNPVAGDAAAKPLLLQHMPQLKTLDGGAAVAQTGPEVASWAGADGDGLRGAVTSWHDGEPGMQAREEVFAGCQLVAL